MATRDPTGRKALMDKLYRETATQLIARLKSGEASSADIKNAIQFLKDNDISASVGEYDLLPEIKEALADTNVLPFPG